MVRAIGRDRLMCNASGAPRSLVRKPWISSPEGEGSSIPEGIEEGGEGCGPRKGGATRCRGARASSRGDVRGLAGAALVEGGRSLVVVRTVEA